KDRPRDEGGARDGKIRSRPSASCTRSGIAPTDTEKTLPTHRNEDVMTAAQARRHTPAAPHQEFVISRTFDAPRELVWKAFTEAERMQHWWGPKGFQVIASKMDLRPGGTYHYGMRAPDGSTMWGKFIYREIVRPERIVAVTSFSDEAGN